MALLSDGQILAEKSWISANDEAAKLPPTIAALLNQNGHKYQDLTALIVISGPGSFTGLRVGVTIANTLRYLLNIPLYHLNTFEYLWLRQGQIAQPQQTALLLFAGQRGLYFQTSPSDQPSLHNLDTVPALLKENNITTTFGDISAQQREVIADFQFLKPTQNFGDTLLNLDLNQLETQQIVQPLYIKGPGITPSKNKLFQ